jgi:hypothetical protein
MARQTAKTLILQVIDRETHKARTRVYEQYERLVEEAAQVACDQPKVAKLLDEYAASLTAFISAKRQQEAEEVAQEKIRGELNKLGVTVENHPTRYGITSVDEKKPIRPQLKVAAVTKGSYGPRYMLQGGGVDREDNVSKFMKKAVPVEPFLKKLDAIETQYDQLMVAVATSGQAELQLLLADYIAKLSVV